MKVCLLPKIWKRHASCISRFLLAGRELFYPSHCTFCKVAVRPGGWLCLKCWRELPRIEGTRCQVCSQPFPGVDSDLVCTNCQGRRFHFVCALVPLRARGGVRETIHQLKYCRQPFLAVLAAQWMRSIRLDDRLRDIRLDAIVPVPLHRRRIREREYNQAELISSHLSKRWKLPLLSSLERIRYTETQTHFDREVRMQNLRGAFRLRKDHNLQGKKVLLVDDVFTTGSTLDECARVLLEGGVEAVWAATVARA